MAYKKLIFRPETVVWNNISAKKNGLKTLTWKKGWNTLQRLLQTNKSGQTRVIWSH